MKDLAITRFAELYGHAPTVLTWAPGRIEFIGNHTDYNGGTVLGAAIDLGMWVAAAPAPAGILSFATDSQCGIVTVPTSAPGKQTGPQRWVNYPLGVWTSFREFGWQQPDGLEYLA